MLVGTYIRMHMLRTYVCLTLLNIFVLVDCDRPDVPSGVNLRVSRVFPSYSPSANLSVRCSYSSDILVGNAFIVCQPNGTWTAYPMCIRGMYNVHACVYILNADCQRVRLPVCLHACVFRFVHVCLWACMCKHDIHTYVCTAKPVYNNHSSDQMIVSFTDRLSLYRSVLVSLRWPMEQTTVVSMDRWSYFIRVVSKTGFTIFTYMCVQSNCVSKYSKYMG